MAAKEKDSQITSCARADPFLALAASGFRWQVFLHFVLALSVALLRLAEPYIARVDQLLEVFALLSLAATAHLASVYETGSKTDGAGQLFMVAAADGGAVKIAAG